MFIGGGGGVRSGVCRTLAIKVLLDQTSALHLFEVRSTPWSMQMMPSTAWGVAEPIYRS